MNVTRPEAGVAAAFGSWRRKAAQVEAAPTGGTMQSLLAVLYILHRVMARSMTAGVRIRGRWREALYIPVSVPTFIDLMCWREGIGA